MTTALVSLALEADWDIGRLTAASFRWPTAEATTVALRNVTSTVPTDSWVDAGAPVITPTGLDPVGGGIRRRSRKYRGPVFQVRASGPGLNMGDLLLPRSPEAPVLLVGSDLLGSLVSSQFLALRTDAASALWIWAVLNSRSGRSSRRFFTGGVMASSATRSRLLNLEIPWPSAREIARRQHHLVDIETQTHRPEEEGSGTWWRTVDLRKWDWNLALAAPNLEVFNTGLPLKTLCREIIRGRPAPREAVREKPTDGFIPITDIGVIGGKPVHRWVSPTVANQIIATPDDVFVAAVGNRPHAALATEDSAVDRNLFLLRLHDPSHAAALVQYLNGQTGYGMRRILLSGTVIPGLRKEALASLPVPEEVLRSSPDPTLLIPLAEQLEQALWS